MRYGYFDDEAREYVITRPDTPQSWSNYLGSTEYGAIITNNAGGYGFFRSGARGRFLRLRFNGVPADQPGRYLYLRDADNGDYWSASWQPVGKPLDRYRSTCRHGTGYTTIESHYDGIASQVTYFVPLGRAFEYWWLRVTNEGDRLRRLSAFTFCEFTNQWDTFQDNVNLQYSLFIVRGELTGDSLLRIAIQDHLTGESDGIYLHDIARHAWMSLTGASLSGFDTSREAFLGRYRGYHNPLVVEQGHCTNSRAYGDNACGVLQTDLTLAPGETREVLLLLSIGDARAVGVKTMAEFGSLERAGQEFGLSLAVRDRDRDQRALHAAQQDRGARFHAHQRHPCLVLLRGVAHEARPVRAARDDVAQAGHHLAAVADTEREGVAAREEALELRARALVEQHRLRPAAAGAQHVAVGEATAGRDAADRCQVERAREHVAHVHVDRLEAGAVEGRGHLVLPVDALLAQHRHARARAGGYERRLDAPARVNGVSDLIEKGRAQVIT